MTSPQTAAGDVSSPRLSALEVVAFNVIPFLHAYEVRSLLLTSKSLAGTISSIFRKDANAVHHLRKSSPPPSIVDIFARGDVVATDIQCLHFYQPGADIAKYGAISEANVAELNRIATEMILTRFNGFPRSGWDKVAEIMGEYFGDEGVVRDDVAEAFRVPREFYLTYENGDEFDSDYFDEKIIAVLKNQHLRGVSGAPAPAPDRVHENNMWSDGHVFVFVWPGTSFCFNYGGSVHWFHDLGCLVTDSWFSIGGCVRGTILFLAGFLSIR